MPEVWTRQRHSRTRRRAAAAPWAVVAAVLFLVAAGVAYRFAFAKLNRVDARLKIPKETLQQVPLEIGGWAGGDEELPEAIVRAADVDDYLNRAYRDDAAGTAVGCFVALGIRARDLAPHRPEVCYPGSGWTLKETHDVELPVAGRTPIAARAYTFLPGAMDELPLVVLNYYIVDGETCPDVSLLRSKAARGQTAIRYMAQIQITSRIGGSRTSRQALEVASGFAVALDPPLGSVLAAIAEAPEPD